MAITKNDVLAWIDQATMLEISDLVKNLEEKYGITAAAAMPMAVGGGSGGSEAKPAVEEQTEFSVVLAAVGDKKINVIKAVREVTSLGLEGSQGSGRRRAQAHQGRRVQGRGRDDQEEVRRSRRHRRDQVVLERFCSYSRK